MDTELSVKLQKLTSNTDMTDRQFIDLLTYVQQEIAKARIEELSGLNTRRHYGKDYQESLDDLSDYKDKRIAELSQTLKESEK